MPEGRWRRFVPVRHGYVCDVCGLSDFGFQRFLSLCFDPRPCRRCLDHFMPVLGPFPPVPLRVVEDSSLVHQGQAATGSSGNVEAGTPS